MRRALALAAAVACMVSVQVISTVAPAAAYPSDTVVISGHGFGHGRGMGQWGSLGYALQGQSYTQILAHYYSNTTAGGIDPNTGISVQLVGADGRDAIISEPSAAPSVNGAPIPGNAVLVRETAPGSNVFNLFYGPGCGGPWPASASATVNGTVTVTPNGAGADPNTMLHVCLPTGETAYEG